MLAKPLSSRYEHASEIVMDLEEGMDKQGLRRDRRALADFFKDPEGYTRATNDAMLARLAQEAPRGVDKNRNVGIRHYRKILHLNPDDDVARAMMEKFGEQAPAGAGERARPTDPPRRAAASPVSRSQPGAPRTAAPWKNSSTKAWKTASPQAIRSR